MPNDLDPLPLPSVAEEKEAFHKIANIENFPEFRPRANELAKIYLSNANFNATSLYNEFEYDAAAFDTRMKEIYDGVLPGMYAPHPYDNDVITWSNGKKYRIGKASDKVVKDRLVQLAPFNLMDGVWLQNILQARPSDDVQSRLFKIWSDEVGNGESQQNHSNVYENLLLSQGINLPPVSSLDFLDIDVAPGAWRAPVFQMCMGLFPQEFFPELIGMTLLLEWEATPTLMPAVNMLRGRGIDPLFYALHVAIDNISEGHGAISKEAVKIYLDEKFEEGGDEATQMNWLRIWRGYVTWATAGFSGEGLAIRRLEIDRKSINIGTPDSPICIPDFKSFYRNRMIGLIGKKAPYAKDVHGAVSVGGVKLNSLFDNPEELLDKLLDAKFFDIKSPRDSRFFDLLEFDGPMYKVFTSDDVDTVLDWLESVSISQEGCIEPLPQTSPSDDAVLAVIGLINDVASRAKRSHDELILPDETGKAVPLVSFFDSPQRLMSALIRGGWVIPYAADRSMLITRVVENSGPMEGELTPEQVESLKKWINEGALMPSDPDVMRFGSDKKGDKEVKVETSAEREMSFLEQRPFIGQGSVH